MTNVSLAAGVRTPFFKAGGVYAHRTDAPPGPAGSWLIDQLNGSSRARSKN